MKFEGRRDVQRLLMAIIGATLSAINIRVFVRAAEMYPGGMTGLALLLQTVVRQYLGLEIPFTVINFLLNAFPFYIAVRFLGRKLTLLSLLTIAIMSVLTDVLPDMRVTSDPLLVCVFGGILGAFAGSISLRAGSTGGGTDLIAMYVAQRYERDAFNTIFACNAAMLIAAGLLFGWEKAFYSIIYQFVSTQALHVFFKSFQKHTLFIITDRPEEVYKKIHETTRHGGTLFRGTGLYQQHERTMVYSVVSSDEIRHVLPEVKRADPQAFINVVKTDQFAGRFYRKPTD